MRSVSTGVSKNDPKAAVFIGCTSVLMARGHGYNHPIMVRIEFEQQPDGSITLTSRGGHTGTRIKSAGVISMPAVEWESRQFERCDSLALTKWAFSKTGWIYGQD